MMSEMEVSERLTRAVMADMSENPTLFNELAAQGPDSITNALNQDVLTALKGDPGQSMFPHLRGTMKDMIGLAKSEVWASTGRYIGEEAVKVETNAFDFVGSLVKSLATVGTAIYSGIVAKDIAGIQASSIQAQQAAAQRAAAAQQQTAAQQGGFATASMFGGGMGVFLLLGVAGAAIYVISTQIGKKSRRR